MSESQAQLSREEQEESIQKYDAVANTRDLTGLISTVVFFILLSFALFQLYKVAFGQYTTYIHRTVHLGFALVLIFLLFPMRRRSGKRQKIAWYEYVLALLALIVCGYWPLFYETVVQQIGGITQIQ